MIRCLSSREYPRFQRKGNQNHLYDRNVIIWNIYFHIVELQMTSGSCVDCSGTYATADMEYYNINQSLCIQKCQDDPKCRGVSHGIYSGTTEWCQVYQTRVKGSGFGSDKCFAIPDNCKGKLQFHWFINVTDR